MLHGGGQRKVDHADDGRANERVLAANQQLPAAAECGCQQAATHPRISGLRGLPGFGFYLLDYFYVYFWSCGTIMC